eukprot:CAMPEP_0195539544 /NCGR_PEP_ID=MMETSP0794_2-20130614/50104_1 /TAXON_ID=515487 /ORGANISM="Stephanopyxis turris, Strain CCMP 815" /LENGTH=392 /DNA_ID=CAMNT_0040673581 /DNA_START=54 /DNA_END=1232 /DNA_ORIENTATION=+
MSIPIDELTSLPPPAPIQPIYYGSVFNHETKTDLPPTVRTLREQGYTTGLSNCLIEHASSFPHRIYVVDNSGSMNQTDGQLITATGVGREVRIDSCTRWMEMQELVSYHVQMAALLRTPSIFRFLTDPGPSVGMQMFSVADKGSNMIQHDVEVAMDTIQKTIADGYSTPLTWQIDEIRHSIQTMLLPATQKKQILIVLATDGLPTNVQGEGGTHELDRFMVALEKLEGLPISVVVRLCTNDEKVCRFYKSIAERNLSFSVTIVDDFLAEASAVHRHNRWLTYALPLQRLRALGFPNTTIDFLSVRPLTKLEVKEFCILLFGTSETLNLPSDVERHWKGFCTHVKQLLQRESEQWNPIAKKFTPWIDVRRLEEDYEESCCGRVCLKLRHKICF